MPQVWTGVDAGKTHHHCVVIDTDGRPMLSRRVLNDETELPRPVADVQALGADDPVTLAVHLADGGAALLIGLPAGHDRQLPCIPGRAVNRAAGGCRGEGRTDARDAAIITDQARMRRDPHPLRPGDGITTEPKPLTGRRTDPVCDRTRSISRLRELLTSILPGLERALDVTDTGPLVPLTGYRTPTAPRRVGQSRLGNRLRHRKVRGAAALAAKAVQAAQDQHIALPAEALTAQLIATLAIATLAGEVMTLNEQTKDTDKLIEGRFRRHRHAEVITSLPGIGTLLGAESPAATGGDLHRPQRYHRGLRRIFYTPALISIRFSPESRRFYDRERAEGKHHTQAVLALARRRVDVLWALPRDGRCYQPTPPVTAAA